MYIYNDEDNEPMNDFDQDGHNPTVYLNAYEMRMYEKYGEPEPKEPDDGCWNCLNYDGDHCTKEWNNLDKSYYIDWRDDKEPNDYCSDWKHDPDAIYEQFFEED